jgi:hypothetical protein
MKRLAGLVAIAVVSAATFAFAAGSAGADGGATCTTGSGQAKFAPGLSTDASTENVVVKGTLMGCTGSTFTDAALLVHLPRGTALLTCDSLTTGAPDLLAGKAIVKWVPAGSKNSMATVTATLSGANSLHITGVITTGSFTGSTLTTDVVLTPELKTFPPTVKAPPALCSQKNRLKKATYSSSSFVIA